jgi:triacylglycerol esterase/lipase EstA (alpha/beta hydrolase family)
VVFVCHSMGGLLTRYYVDVLGGHEITRSVVTIHKPDASMDLVFSDVSVTIERSR